MAVGSAIVAGIGLTASIVGGRKQMKSQEEAQKKAEQQAQDDLYAAQEQDRKLRLQAAEDAKQASEGATFGVQKDEKAGTYNDFAAPSSTPNVGGKATLGLGFA